MKYFVGKSELSGTCYHEFSMGEWDGETFWQEDSIYLHDDILYKHAGFAEAIINVVPEYDPFGEVTINHNQWKMIGCYLESCDASVIELYHEANQWAMLAFKKHDVITILGI